MNILQVSTSDLGGGAERCAWSLFQQNRSRGYHSWLAVGHKRSSDPDVLEIPRPIRTTWDRGLFYSIEKPLMPLEGRIRGIWRLRSWLHTLAGGWPEVERQLGREDFNFPGSRSLLQLPPRKPDLIHAHNLHGRYFDLRILPYLSRQAPLVLTLHDAWLLSGHCAHSFDCERWRTGCGHCPDLTIPRSIKRDATARNWKRKRQILEHSRLFVVTPSHWLMERVRQSMLEPIDARVIPNGVDLNMFHPANQSAARTKLGLPGEASILLFAANGGRHNPFKDYDTIEQALMQLGQRDLKKQLILLVLGGDASDEQIGCIHVRHVPFQAEPYHVARYYQAADIYIHAAKADNFPYTVLEALACNAPVVATAVGGIPEQIVDGETGFLVPPREPSAIAARVGQLIDDESLCHRMGARAAESAREHFDLERQADSYLSWYGEVIEHWNQERECHALPNT